VNRGIIGIEEMVGAKVEGEEGHEEKTRSSCKNFPLHYTRTFFLTFLLAIRITQIL
jgi:hypothetical protein